MDQLTDKNALYDACILLLIRVGIKDLMDQLTDKNAGGGEEEEGGEVVQDEEEDTVEESLQAAFSQKFSVLSFLKQVQ